MFFILFVFVESSNIFAQDLNQTNIRYYPLYLNPALTGNFKGNYRIGGTVREQGKELMSQGYQTAYLYLDSPVSISFGKNNWIGAGIQVYKDQAGTLPLNTTGVILSVAYHYSFDKKYNKVISIGFQYGNIVRTIDSKKIILESDFISSGTKNDRIQLTDYKNQFSDINAGIYYKVKFNKVNLWDVGLSVYHIPKPGKNNYLKNQFNIRYTLNSGLKYRVTRRFAIKPQITLSISKNAYNFIPQFKTFFKLSKKKKNDDMIYAGLGYRINDALLMMFGIRYKKIDVGIAYDLTISSAAQYNYGQGGLEIGVFKIINISKKPKTVPVLHCPNL